MIRVDNELWTPSPIAEDRIPHLECVAMLDIVRTSANRYGLAPDDLTDNAARALLASTRPDRTQAENLAAAERLLVDVFETAPFGEAKEALDAFTKRLEEAVERDGMPTDAQVAYAVSTLRHAKRIRECERREVEALRACERDPTPETRAAYAAALAATDAAHREVPAARRSLSDTLDAVLERARAGQGKAAVGLTTPRFPNLSDALFGWRGLCIVGAAPGLGKTTLAVAAGIDAVEENPTACLVFVSFEMPTETLVERILCDMAGVPQRALRTGPPVFGASMRDGLTLTETQHDGLEDAKRRILNLSPRVALVGKNDIGVMSSASADGRDCMSKVEALVVDLKRRSGCSRSFVVIDYLAIVPVERREKEPFANDTDRMRFILSGLTTLRDNLDGDANPVVVVAQARKADFDEPTLASIMGTADTAYSADAIVVMKREEVAQGEKPPGPTEPQPLLAKVVKGRDMMQMRTLRMSFDPMSSSISESEMLS